MYSCLGPKHSLATVVIACGLLTYGGVSLFVVAFAIYPIARDLFRAADIPKNLIPANIAMVTPLFGIITVITLGTILGSF